MAKDIENFGVDLAGRKVTKGFQCLMSDIAFNSERLSRRQQEVVGSLVSILKKDYGFPSIKC